MSHWPGRDPHPRRAAQLFQIVESRILARKENKVKHALGRAEIDQLVEIVLDAGFAQDCVRYHAAGNACDGEPVRPSGAVHVIGRLSASGARHVLRHDGWVSRNVLRKKCRDGFTPKISGSARPDTVDESDGLAFVERALRL